ncbi:MAB_1171c family putative transporter [Pseudonocardia sp. RS010]|uniref:MAB_1171c family putative transporter n=1 Tax=Pseudonocardia sp. RS010 TaxID=3385979 RepID=UPI0039A0901A
MNVKLSFSITTAVVLVTVAAWQWRQLLRHPKDLPLRVLVVGVSSIAFVVTFGLPFGIFEPLHEALDVVHFSNIAWAVMIWSFAAFFLLVGPADGNLTERWRQATRELGMIAAAMAVMLLVQYMAPPGTWHYPRIPEDYRTWQNIVFYLSSSAVPFALWVLGTVRAVRFLQDLRHAWARIAVMLVVGGAGAMEVGVDGIVLLRQALYIAFPGSKWPVLTTLYNVGRLGGQITLAAGLAAAPLAALVPRMRDGVDDLHRRVYVRRLHPLWQRLTDEFPYIVLPETHETRDRGLTATAARCEQLMSEITDGLAHLAPYCSQHPADPSGIANPQQAAKTIDDGLTTLAASRRIRWSGGEYQTPLPPYPKLEPEFDGKWRDRARWMTRVSRELEKASTGEAEEGIGGLPATH